jgi:uracil-DNA glycosylase
MVTVEIEPTFESWQAAARALLSDGVGPGDVDWRERPGVRPPPAAARFFRVPPRFLDLARQAAAAQDAARWDAL